MTGEEILEKVNLDPEVIAARKVFDDACDLVWEVSADNPLIFSAAVEKASDAFMQLLVVKRKVRLEI